MRGLVQSESSNGNLLGFESLYWKSHNAVRYWTVNVGLLLLNVEHGIWTWTWRLLELFGDSLNIETRGLRRFDVGVSDEGLQSCDKIWFHFDVETKENELCNTYAIQWNEVAVDRFDLFGIHHQIDSTDFMAHFLEVTAASWHCDHVYDVTRSRWLIII